MACTFHRTGLYIIKILIWFTSIGVLCYFIKDLTDLFRLGEENDNISTLFFVISILLAGAVAGHFRFSYKDSRLGKFSDMILAHVTTLFLMFTIAVLVVLMYYLVQFIVPTCYSWFQLVIFSLLVSVLFYDIWDYRQYLVRN